MPSLDDRIEDNFVMWASVASTPVAFHELSRELRRIWAENPYEYSPRIKISCAVTFLGRLVELEYDDVLRVFYTEHPEIVREVARVCIDVSSSRVSQAFQDKILGLMRTSSDVVEALPHE